MRFFRLDSGELVNVESIERICEDRNGQTYLRLTYTSPFVLLNNSEAARLRLSLSQSGAILKVVEDKPCSDLPSSSSPVSPAAPRDSSCAGPAGKAELISEEDTHRVLQVAARILREAKCYSTAKEIEGLVKNGDIE